MLCWEGRPSELTHSGAKWGELVYIGGCVQLKWWVSSERITDACKPREIRRNCSDHFPTLPPAVIMWTRRGSAGLKGRKPLTEEPVSGRCCGSRPPHGSTQPAAAGAESAGKGACGPAGWSSAPPAPSQQNGRDAGPAPLWRAVPLPYRPEQTRRFF